MLCVHNHVVPGEDPPTADRPATGPDVLTGPAGWDEVRAGDAAGAPTARRAPDAVSDG